MPESDKKLIVVALWNLAIYAPVFCGFGAYAILTKTRTMPALFEWVILPWHFLGILLMFFAFYVTLKDLFLRPFPTPVTRLKWLAIIWMTGGIGWLIYLRRYGFKPRPTQDATRSEIAGSTAFTQ